MIALTETRPQLLELFDPAGPGMPMLFSMLEGRSPADIRVDEPDHPAQCLIRNGVRMTFASRGVSQTFLEQAIANLRLTGGVALAGGMAATSAGPAAGWVPPESEIQFERLEFRSLDVENGGYLSALQGPFDGTELRPIDRESFERCLWKDMMLAFCGTADGFLQHGFGLTLRRDDEILAEAYACVLGRSVMEIGVITAEAHRGKGYATRVSAHLIDRCLEKGYGVFWSCESDNPASAALARRLGFQDESTYTVHGYPSTKPKA